MVNVSVPVESGRGVLSKQIDRLANAAVPLPRDTFRIIETGPANPDQIKAAFTSMTQKMSADAQKVNAIDHDFKLGRADGGGDVLSCSYTYKQGMDDQGTSISLALMQGQSDEQLLEAWKILMAKRNLIRERKNNLQTAQGLDRDIEAKLGITREAEREDTTELANAEDPVICVEIGTVYVRPIGGNRLLSMAKTTNDDPVKMKDEEWTLFKVVSNGKIKYRLQNEYIVLDEVKDSEEGNPVSSGKLLLLEQMLREATLRSAEFTSQQTSIQNDGINPLEQLTRYT